MGVLSAFGRVLGVTRHPVIDAASRDLAVYAPQAVVSPWSERGDLQRVVIRDLYGADVKFPLSRGQACGIPAVSRGVLLVSTDIAGCPLRVLRDDAVDTVQPAWLTRTDGPQTPWHRMLWTVDDLIYHGISLWGVIRGSTSDGSRGPILDGVRIPWDDWELDADGFITYRGTYVNPDDVLLFTGPHEGILNKNGGNTLRVALDLEETVSDRAANPVAITELHYVGDGELSDDEIKAYLAAWKLARSARGGAVAWTPRDIETKDHGQAADNGFLVQARNASAVDCLRLIGIPAAMADASNVNASLTYETTQGRNQEYVDRCLNAYTGAIAARLSQDDVVPRGKRVAFDLAQLIAAIPAPTGAATPD